MMTALLILFAFLNLADGYTTWHVLRFGGYERNKVIVWLMERMGRYWALVFIKVLAGGRYMVAPASRSAGRGGGNRVRHLRCSGVLELPSAAKTQKIMT